MRNYTLTILNYNDGQVYQYNLDNKSRYFDIKTDEFLINKFCKDYYFNLKNIEYMLSNKEGVINLIDIK